MTQPSLLHIVAHEGLPRAPIDELEAELVPAGVMVRRSEQHPTVFASLELFIPPAVVAIVAVGVNAYVRTFAEESAKSHVRLIEAALKRLGRKILGPRWPDVGLAGTRGKLPPVLHYSHRFGLVADFGEGQRIRLVFSPGEDPTQAIACFFILLEQLRGPRAGEVTVAGDPGPGHHGLFVRYDSTLNELVFINPLAVSHYSTEATPAGLSDPHC